MDGEGLVDLAIFSALSTGRARTAALAATLVNGR